MPLPCAHVGEARDDSKAAASRLLVVVIVALFLSRVVVWPWGGIYPRALPRTGRLAGQLPTRDLGVSRG